MRIVLDVLRRAGADQPPYRQRFLYEYDDPAATVATALNDLNGRDELTDEQGAPAEPIAWSNSCLQRRCGACAMRINGTPALACDTRLKKLGRVARLEPLLKFPVVRDLRVDREIMREGLRRAGAFLEREAGPGASGDDSYDASRCLRCGLCLEVCPNFAPGGRFLGAAGLAALTRLIHAAQGDERKRLSALYKRHVYAGCGKSLACRDICPAGLPLDAMLSRSNAAAVWRRALKDDT